MLEVQGLNTGYGNVEILHDIDFHVGEGECVALIGANGAGKTSTLKAICGILPVWGGKVRFLGDDITNQPGHSVVKAGITMCPEGRQVFPQMDVVENLSLGAYARKDGEIKDDIEKMMDMFPILRTRADQKAGTMSGGEQEMLAIARALMARPKLCIFDEPSLGLAPKIIAEVEDTIARIKSLGMTILLVEQNSQMALRLAERAYLFETGHIVLQGSSDELQQNPEVIKAYLGD